MAEPHPKQDICIIGAGPAGLAAGLRLSQLGIPFTIIEKERFPRSKICGDGISGKSLLMLKRLDEGLLTSLGHLENALPSWGVRFYAPSGKEVRISFRDKNTLVPSGYVVPRIDFDNLLYEKVKASGFSEIIEGTTVKKIDRFPEGFRLSLDDQDMEITTKLVVLGSGYTPGLIRDLDPESNAFDNLALGLRIYFENVSGVDKDNLIEIHFLKELLPCYLWIFPLGEGKANVGLALPKDIVLTNKISLQKLLYELIEKYPKLKSRFKAAKEIDKAGAQQLPFFQGRIPVSGDHYLLLGDAARIVDPFTGEGIANAMLSGILAADTAAEALKLNDLSNNTLKVYDDRLYQDLDKELSLGLRLQDLGKNAMLINLVVGRASRSKKIRDLLKDILFGMNSMKELGKPIFYIKLMLGLE